MSQMDEVPRLLGGGGTLEVCPEIGARGPRRSNEHEQGMVHAHAALEVADRRSADVRSRGHVRLAEAAVQPSLSQAATEGPREVESAPICGNLEGRPASGGSPAYRHFATTVKRSAYRALTRDREGIASDNRTCEFVARVC
jgi:hypothetical protein